MALIVGRHTKTLVVVLPLAVLVVVKEIDI
jgi:hypothetical protein